MKNSRSNIRGFSAAIVFIFCLLVWIITPSASAADLVDRDVTLSSSFVSEVVDHRFRFSTQGPSTIASVGFEYCANSPLFSEPCTPPAGLDVTAATITSQVGLSGFSVSAASVANNLIITRASPGFEPALSADYTFSDITNPSTADQIVYVRISVFDAIDGGGTRVDEGSVVFVIEDRFNISAYVPPYMIFCVGVTVALDCSSSTGFLADFGEFSTSQATAVTTQFSVSTNDPTGYNAFISGQTMTSGTNIIPALPLQTGSSPGTPQFGINLRANSSPSVGSDPQAGPVASGAPDVRYNTPNQFRFVSGDRIASSPVTTGFNRYTVSYIVNIDDNQAPGVYAATFAYTAIASF